MENASKALIIAGGILLAALLIAILLFMFGKTGELSNEIERGKKVEQLAKFNEEFEAYNREWLRGTDILSVINKLENNNEKYKEGYERNSTDYAWITWKLIISDDYYYMKDVEKINATTGRRYTDKEPVLVLRKGTYTDSNYSNFKNQIKQLADTDTGFKKAFFDCTSLKYNSTTGRVNYIEFRPTENPPGE